MNEVQAVKSRWFSGSSTRDGARELLSGMIAGFVGKIFAYPMDTVKVLMQTQGGVRGPIDVVKQVHKERGLLSLYQGLTSPLIGCMAECAILFVAFDYIKKMLKAEDTSLSSSVPWWKVSASGGLSGMFSACVMTPAELIKCRLQIQQGVVKVYNGPVDCILKTVKQSGFVGLWKGNLTCLAREVPGTAAWFGTYDFIMRTVQGFYNIERREDVPRRWSALGGAAAGVLYWAVPYPADTVKSRIQTDVSYHGMSCLQVLRSVIQTEGAQGLYRGLPLTCCRAMPSHALVFYSYALANNFILQY